MSVPCFTPSVGVSPGTYTMQLGGPCPPFNADFKWSQGISPISSEGTAAPEYAMDPYANDAALSGAGSFDVPLFALMLGGAAIAALVIAPLLINPKSIKIRSKHRF